VKGRVLDVHVIPSGLVAAILVFVVPAPDALPAGTPAVVQNNPSWGDHVTDDQNKEEAKARTREVHDAPSGLVTKVRELAATATNKPTCGDQHMLVQASVIGKVCEVHVMPSGLVAARLVEVVEPVALAPPATAQNNPSCGDHVIAFHVVAVPGKVLAVHVIPSGLVAAVVVDNRSNDPIPATAHQIPSSGAHTDDDQMFEVIAAFVNTGVRFGLGIAKTFVETAVVWLYTMTLLGAPVGVRTTLLAVRTPE
jgi:hypothetical protein